MLSGIKEFKVADYDPDLQNYPALKGPFHALDIAAGMIPDERIKGKTARHASRKLGQWISRGYLRRLHDNNTHVIGETVIVMASRYYAESWGRDDMSATHFADSKPFTKKLVTQRLERSNKEGNPPAQTNYRPIRPMAEYRDDETALRVGIRALETGVGTDEQLDKNHGYIKKHVTEDGGYETGKGPRHTMVDGLHVSNPAVWGHNTLLYAHYMQQALAKEMATPWA